jgi:preprotein translocase subunit YajC
MARRRARETEKSDTMDMTLLFPILILLLFIPIFLSGRKQKRQQQQTQQMQNALSEGDVVTTTSGLRGTIVDASYEDTIDLEIADGVVTTWLRAAVRDKVQQEVPVEDTHEDEAEPAEQPTLLDGPSTGTVINGVPTSAEKPADEKK